MADLSSFFKQQNQQRIFDKDIIDQQLKKIQGIYDTIKIKPKHKPQEKHTKKKESSYQVDYSIEPIFLTVNKKYLNCKEKFYEDYPPIKLPLIKSDPKPISLPYFLTDKEKRKIWREKKIEKHEKTQELILLGNLPKPKPRATLANMHKVYPRESQTDPTRLELKIRKEV